MRAKCHKCIHCIQITKGSSCKWVSCAKSPKYADGTSQSISRPLYCSLFENKEKKK